MKTINPKIKCSLGIFLFLSHTIFAQQWVRWETSVGGNGHWYKAVANTNGLNWTQADQLARNEGGHLATITSSAENDFVFSLVNDPQFFSAYNGSGPALGGYNAGTPTNPVWSWVTGEPFSFTNWCPGLPDYADSGNGPEDRLHYFSFIGSTPAKTWNDIHHADNNLGGYVIEREDRPAAARSGFFGQAFIAASDGALVPVSGTPVRISISVYDSRGRLVSWNISNPVGQFYSYLKPGNYTLIGSLLKQKLPPKNLSQIKSSSAHSWVRAEITVIANQLTPVEMDFE